MPFTNAQTKAFLENANQMAIPRVTTIELANEGIATVADLSEIDKESLKQIANNLRRPGGMPHDRYKKRCVIGHNHPYAPICVWL